jgi:nucleotide-binding universal stress UspA family protein
MFARVLLCYDGSVEGRNALRQGADVALALRAETHLVAILRGTSVAPPEGQTDSAMQTGVEAQDAILREGVEWLRARGLEARGHMVRGDPLVEIPACARAIRADMVVVGHRRRGALARWWSDGESASLLDALSCSVLVACASDTADQ